METVAWACGLLAKTEHLTVFGTVHAPLISPLIAAKEFVTADHIGEGRFGLNLVCGWNEGEFEMFGATLRDHEARYEYAQEWLDIVKLAWSPHEDFDFDGHFFKLKGVRAKPKPYGGTASGDHECRRVAGRPGIRDPQLRRAFFDDIARHLVRGNSAPRQRRAGAGATVGPRYRCLYGRRRHLPAHRAGGAAIITGMPWSTMPIGQQSTIFWR